MNTQNTKPQTSDINQQALWSTTYRTPQGFVCQLTLQGESGQTVIQKAESAIQFLLDQQFVPYFEEKTFARSHYNENHHEDNGDNKETGWCLVHQCEMKRWEKGNRAWFSHKVDGKWCKGK